MLLLPRMNGVNPDLWVLCTLYSVHHALTSLKIRSAYRDKHIQHCLAGPHLCPSGPSEMIVGYLLLGVLTTCGDSRPSTLDTAVIVEGDIAVTERSAGSGTALNAFRTAQESVWPDGIVRYRFDVDQWDGTPVFFEAQRDNISLALQKIEAGVPCIEFR